MLYLKNIFTKLISVLLLVHIMISLPVNAFAAEPIINQIKGSTQSAANENILGKSLLQTAANWKKIKSPTLSDYLDSPFFVYIDAPGGHSVFIYDEWADTEENKIDFAHHGSRVAALADHGDFCCIWFHTQENVRKVGWVRWTYLSSVYPGSEVKIGSDKNWSIKTTWTDDPWVSWSKENFVGTRRKFTILAQPVENCVSFTLDYKVTGRNGSEEYTIVGPRDVYVNDGSDWVYVGSFDYDVFNAPVHVSVVLDEPMRLAAVATVANCSDPNTFIFRQAVLDVRVAK